MLFSMAPGKKKKKKNALFPAGPKHAKLVNPEESPDLWLVYRQRLA